MLKWLILMVFQLMISGVTVWGNLGCVKWWWPFHQVLIIFRRALNFGNGQQIASFAPYWYVFWPFLTPTVEPVKSLWFKMVCTCVLQIVLHVLSSISASGGYFRPQKSILAKIAIFDCFWGLFLTLGSGTSGARNENLRPLFNTNIPPISGKSGLRTHF